MATTKQTDIRKTGPMSYRQLQEANSNEPPVLSEGFMQFTNDLNQQYAPQSLYDARQHAQQDVRTSEFQTDENGVPTQWWGKSQYDNPTATEAQLQQLGDIRYENQPWYDTLANGVGKMLGTAGTTFVSSLVGLPYGLMQAASEGRWSALWDNDVTQGLADVDKWLEDNMTNYRSTEQKESPWYDPSNLFSMNFIADDIIKNAGFTLGAAASMAVGSGGLGLLSKSMGFVNNVSKGTKMASNVLSALFSATGEGMIEARQGVEERNKLETQRLQDALMPEYNALQTEFQQIEQEYAANRGKTMVRTPEGGMADPAYLNYRERMADLAARRDALNQKFDAGRQQIEESGKLMGNKILLANQGLLTAGNLIQFGKAMTKSFDSARHAAEMSSKYAKPFGVGATMTAEGTYEITGKNLGRTVAATKGLFTEGSEEMNQQWIQSSSGAAYNEEDVNDYWRAKLNPEAYRETTQGLYTLGSILDRGFRESWGDVNQWEQFVIGGLTGLAGSYSPTKLFNQDKQYGAFNPRRYGSWEGGAVNELRDFNREYQQYQENIDDVNKILQQEDFPARVKSMIGHTYLESQKEDAVNKDDMKAWKDADDKQTIHDIQAFLRAGKLDDLRAIYNEMSGNLSDEDVENIIKSTTREISAEEDKRNFDASVDEEIGQHQRRITELQAQAQSIADNQEMLNPSERGQYQAAVKPQLEKIIEQIDKEYAAIENWNNIKVGYTGQKRYEGSYVDDKGNKTASYDEIREQVKHNAEELNRKLDSYLESIDYVNRRTNGQLTKDQEDNLAYLHNMGKESQLRMQKIMKNVRQQLPAKFLLKTNKTPEQLTQENASSDLVFYKDENTKEGYVEVDTSAMNDAAFADFFQREVMRGGNIMPEFGETADEKAAREAEEENLSEEEKKKKTRERASKKWQQAMQKMQDDAEEQWDTNWKLLVDNFMDNYKKKGNTNLDETIEAFGKVRQDLQDASDLFNQTGEYQRTLMEYMQNPNKVDEAREKEEKKADKTNAEQQQKNKFAGKTAQQMNQEIADGALDIDDLDDFADADLSDVTDDDVKAAQDEAKKSKNIRQKQASLKQHIQDNLPENPTQEELNAAQMAMQMVDSAALNAEDHSDISIDMPELTQVPLDQVDPNASVDDVDNMNQQVQDMLADAFNAMQEDENEQDDIPDELPSVDGVDAPPPTETGHDPITKTAPLVVPPSSAPSGAANNSGPKIVPTNPLNEGAIDKIIDETKKVTNTNTNGTWRSNTTRHPYGRSQGTYHEDIAKQQFGEQSVEYKRSKAIWEYLNSVGAFDRIENAAEDRLKPGDTVHFMIRNLSQEIYGKDYRQLTPEEKPFALVLLMVNDNGEVIGDLPLVQLEPSFKSGSPTQQVKDLQGLQDKIFKAYDEDDQNGKNYGSMTYKQIIVDGVLHIDGVGNMGMTFDNAKKTPLVSKVKQTMRGVVPYSKTEKHTINEVAAGTPIQMGVKVTGTTVAISRGDKTQHKEIVAPNVGTTGQPYLLMPTPSGEKIAVPFYTKPFDAQQHKNTEMFKLLSNAIYYLLANNNNSASAKEYFKKHTDVIKGLLQVEAQEGKRVISVTPDQITLHLQSLTNPNQKYDISIPKTNNLAQDAVSLVNQLSGIPINVSLEFLNSKIETGLAANEKYGVDYNQVIGEIADINLPANTTHTVNGWFTVELAPTAGLKPSKAVTPKATGTITENIGGRNVEINTDDYTAVDTATGEIIEDDEQVALRLAQIKASKPIYKDKDFIQISINGEVRTYDVKNNKFVKQKEQKPETPASPAPEETSDINITPPASGAIPLGGKPTYQESFNALVKAGKIDNVYGNINGREVIIANINGFKVPFYKSSSGTDGKTKGNWYPFFGVGAGARTSGMNTSDGTWLIKGGIAEMENGYGIPAIQQLQQELNAAFNWNPGSMNVSAREHSVFGKSTLYGSKVNQIALGREDSGVKNGVNAEQHIREFLSRIAPQQPATSGKTLEEIEAKMKQNRTIGRQNKDAWAAIPDDLKLKLVNEGATLVLTYKAGSHQTSFEASLSNRANFIRILNDANMAAKSGNLKVSEAVKPMEKDGVTLSREKEREARRWLAKNLPSLSSEERTLFVERIARAGENGGKMWGSYRAGVIEIQRNAPMGTVYHEAFHYVLDMVLSPEERQEILNIAKEEYGIEDIYAAEERLANDFRRYAMDGNATGIMGRIKRWLRKISDKINRYNRISDTTINQLFWKINNGELAQKSQTAESFEETQQRILMEIRNTQKEKTAWKNLSRETKQALKDSGLSEAAYTDMSLEEKQQWLKCRT